MLDLDGQIILVALRRVEESGDETEDTFFGKVIRFNANTIIVERADGSEFSMPYDEEVIEAAEPGFYELEDGSTYENPGFIAQWVVYATALAREKYGQGNNSGG